MNILHQYIEYLEGITPISTELICSQNAKDGSIYKLHKVKMPNEEVFYLESLERGCMHISKANIRIMLEIFGSEVVERFFTKSQIEKYLQEDHDG